MPCLVSLSLGRWCSVVHAHACVDAWSSFRSDGGGEGCGWLLSSLVPLSYVLQCLAPRRCGAGEKGSAVSGWRWRPCPIAWPRFVSITLPLWAGDPGGWCRWLLWGELQLALTGEGCGGTAGARHKLVPQPRGDLVGPMQGSPHNTCVPPVKAAYDTCVLPR